MPGKSPRPNLVSLDVTGPIWDRFFTVAPLVLIGTHDESGAVDLAPKHMVTPMGWDNYFGFVCAPTHSTYRNVQRDGVFTVSYPRPSQVLYTSLAAAPRCDDDTKPALAAFPTVPAQIIDGVFVEDSYLCLECELDRVIEGFGPNGLIVGKIVAAYVDETAERRPDVDDPELIRQSPLFAYLHPGRFTGIEDSNGFPFPKDMHK